MMLASSASTTDLLQAASLLLAAVAAIYGMWFGDLQAAANQVSPNTAEDAERPLAELRGELRTRVLPLLVATVLTFVVFLPPTITIIKDAAKHFWHSGFSDYDAAETALALATVGAGLLAGEIFRMLRKLNQKAAELSQVPSASSL